jgi:hypothetical protein
MRNRFLIALAGSAALIGSAPAHGQAAFGASTPTSLPVRITLPIFTSGLVSILGSVDYSGPAANLTGTVVINGDLRLAGTSPLTVKSTAKLYVYGNLFAPTGGLRIEQGAHVYFYGNQLVAGAASSEAGNGTLHFISPRPGRGASADGQQRALATDGLAAGTAAQLVDGNGSTWNLDVEHRASAGLTLTDLDANGLADLAVSGTLTLSSDKAPLTLGSNNLVLDQRPAGAQGTIASYSPLRYVYTQGGGLVKVLGLADGASFTFPVGASASDDYTPAQLTNRSGSPATLGVAVAASAPMPATLAAGRYWTLGAPVATTVDLVLQHNLATNQVGYNNSQAMVAGNGAGTWKMMGTPAVGTATGPLSTTGSVSGASALSQLQLTVPASAAQFTKESAVPLPVTLVDFTASRATDGRVVLRWNTASELNNEGFQVEGSTDAQTWLPRGSFVAGNGTSTLTHRYTWQESSPAATYYRLAQRDFSGTLTYSPVRYVNAQDRPTTLTVYPNPGALQSTVRLSGASPTEATDLYYAVGQLAAHFPAGTTDLSLTGLPAGLYLIRHAGQTLRLVVQ